MKRVLITLLCAVLLASCATPSLKHYSNNAEHMAAQGIVPTDVPPPLPMAETSPPSTPGVSGWDVLGAAVLFPLLLPVAMITSYPSYSGVHCRSYTYKDQYHVKCY